MTNVKNAANTAINAASTWWKSEGFYTSLLVLAASFFVGFPSGEVGAVVSALFALIGAGWALRGKFKDINPVSWKEWFAKPNTWAALVTVVVAIVPSIPVDAVNSVGQILRDLLGQNWQGAITGFFMLLNIILNRVKS